MILILSLCSISLALGRNASLLLYCRCGMDHSDPYHRNSDTDCSVIQEWVFFTILARENQFFWFSYLNFTVWTRLQYHDKVEGVAGNFTGIKIANSTTCSIDLGLNPKGKCRKQIFAYHQTSGVKKVDDTNYDHFEIMWSCVTIEEDATPIDSECKSGRNQDTICCATNNCNDSPSNYTDYERKKNH